MKFKKRVNSVLKILYWFIIVILLINSIKLGRTSITILHTVLTPCCDYQKDLITYIETHSSLVDTTIAVPANFFTRIGWERMYIIRGPASDYDIEIDTGTKYKKFLNVTKVLFLFTYNNKIVKEYRSDIDCKCSFEQNPMTINYSDTLIIHKTNLYKYKIIGVR